jgi:hypothetical protein
MNPCGTIRIAALAGATVGLLGGHAQAAGPLASQSKQDAKDDKEKGESRATASGSKAGVPGRATGGGEETVPGRDTGLPSGGGEQEGRATGPSSGLPTPVVLCEGREELVLRGRTIETDGVGVEARENGHIVIGDCQIRSGSIAIRASGDADVEIDNSHIEGAVAAVQYEGNSDVEASQTEFVGPLARSGRADFEDKGGNTFKKR